MAWQHWTILRLSVLTFLNLYIFVNGFQITGIQAGVDSATGARPFRYEINQFAESGPPFDLYILALQLLQVTDPSRLLSYFQISGIHGFPHQPWDGVLGSQDAPGYCVHGAATFPPWHRPFVALYEQAIWSNAQMIALSYPLSQRDEYTAAALTLRIPYWDWVVNPALPEVVITPTIGINTPNGFSQINNPLYNYTFQGDAAENGFPSGEPVANFPWTVRNWNANTLQSNQSASTASLMAQAATILSMTYQIFTSITDYAAVCTTSQTITANNLENIHNSIHNSVGGYGHMTFPEMAAFDPIFWLHHANVDRQFAMWQTLNPDSYLQPTVNNYGTYVELPGSIDSGNTSLYPFHSDNGTTFFTSDDVRGTLLFGYTYPELVDWNVSLQNLQSSLRSIINTLYNPNRGTSTKAASIKLAPRGADIASLFSHITFDMAKDLGINNLETQWSIQIQVDRFAYDTAFVVDFFMGIPPANPASWATAPNLIGSHAQFIAANVSLMHPNGVPDGLVHGEVSMTHTLAAGVARGVLDDLNPGSVLPLLHDNLHWKARTADNREIDIGALTALSVSVASRSLTPAQDLSEFPTYGAFQNHPKATRHKQGGAQQWHRIEG